jgi:hypothetical protein
MVRNHGCLRRLRNSDWKTPCATPGALERVPDTVPSRPARKMGDLQMLKRKSWVTPSNLQEFQNMFAHFEPI